VRPRNAIIVALLVAANSLSLSLSHLRWEQYQTEEEASLGRGKRLRKAVSYRETFATIPNEALSEVILHFDLVLHLFSVDQLAMLVHKLIYCVTTFCIKKYACLNIL
jgi:hypothetical protein